MPVQFAPAPTADPYGGAGAAAMIGHPSGMPAGAPQLGTSQADAYGGLAKLIAALIQAKQRQRPGVVNPGGPAALAPSAGAGAGVMPPPGGGTLPPGLMGPPS